MNNQTAAPAVPIPHSNPSNWPIVLGTIAIVLGAGGFLMNLVSATLSGRFNELMTSQPNISPEVQESMQATMELESKWSSWTLGSQFIVAGLALLLLIGGILLIRRRIVSMKVLKSWAVIKMVFAVTSWVLFVFRQRAMLDVIDASPEAMGGVLAGMSIFGLIWGCALPIFMLIWFARKKIKDEVEQWA